MTNAFGFFLQFGKKVFSAGHRCCVYLYLRGSGGLSFPGSKNKLHIWLLHTPIRKGYHCTAAGLQLLMEKDITLVADVSSLQVFNISK